MTAAASSANEVLARLADIANSDLLDFLDLAKADGILIDLKLLKRLGLGHVIKRVRTRSDGTREIELEPRLPARSSSVNISGSGTATSTAAYAGRAGQRHEGKI